uniref:Uncharacterized protein n=1 Tax=Mesocestoides corti TaxID=53468 RepID=A0A5K3FT76_MESCO
MRNWASRLHLIHGSESHCQTRFSGSGGDDADDDWGFGGLGSTPDSLRPRIRNYVCEGPLSPPPSLQIVLLSRCATSPRQLIIVLCWDERWLRLDIHPTTTTITTPTRTSKSHSNYHPHCTQSESVVFRLDGGSLSTVRSVVQYMDPCKCCVYSRVMVLLIEWPPKSTTP